MVKVNLAESEPTWRFSSIITSLLVQVRPYELSPIKAVYSKLPLRVNEYVQGVFLPHLEIQIVLVHICLLLDR